MRNRRKHDGMDTRDIAIQTQALLELHTQTDDQHFSTIREEIVSIKDDIKEDIGVIHSKIDRLNRNQIFAAGALAAITVLMNFPQLLTVLTPTQAHAQIPLIISHR